MIYKLDFSKSKVDSFTLFNKNFFVKRDDLISSEFSGNKARKFYYYIKNPPKNKKIILSYGSNQSNAMSSLSYLAKKLKMDFFYYCDHVSSFLLKNPIGNFKEAVDNGMKLIDKSTFLGLKDKDDTLYIKEGGAIKEAEQGVRLLANEIKEYIKENNLKDIDIFLPSGTGTTALYLQKNLNFRVFTTPCVGDKQYLIKQFNELEVGLHPYILTTKRKFHFGKPYKELLDIYFYLSSKVNMEFELLYDTVGFVAILENIDKLSKNILYIHQGGLKGNISMHERYKRKYPQLYKNSTISATLFA